MTLAELESQRKLVAQSLGMRYTKLTKRQAMDALVKANAPKVPRGNPFPTHKE